MCGFAGVVAWDERYRVTRETLARMSARIAHRGPDGEGVWFNHEAEITPDRPQAALAHRRLAILDPDPRSNQPFTDGAGRWLVFNGEIYNFRELRKEIDALRPGYEWKTTGDTEVLLRAYDAWGEKCVEHLNGMFAFAVWDERERSLFLARDRMGQKPLYMASPPDHSAIAFASELGSLLQVPWVSRRTHLGVLPQYLRHGYFSAPFTVYEDVFELPASRRMSARHNAREPSMDWYYDANQPHAPDASNEAAVLTVRRPVERAVSRQLVSDVPLGCFLSGGVDSSIVAAAMRSALPSDQRVLTFSIGFDDPRYDERDYAARVARHLGTEHRQFVVQPDAARDLPLLAAAFGQPFADSSALPTYYLSEQTRAHVKVALSGDGGDELFGGYDRYRAMGVGQRMRLIPQAFRGRKVDTLLARVGSGHPKSFTARARRLLGSLDQPPGQRYDTYLRLFDDPLLRQIYPVPDLGFHPGGALGMMLDDYAEERGVVPAALAVDRLTYLPGDLLTKVDRASMLHALEVRSPFMDHELVSFAAGLTTDQLLKGGPKRMLREAFAADLPAWVFKRKKMGFAVPIGDWLRGPLRPMLHDLLFAADSFAAGHFNPPAVRTLVEEHERNRVDHSQRLYALLMLELWWRGR